jgi:hypothetical protein
MAIRSNTNIFSYDPLSPRITARDVHKCLHAEIRIQVQKVQMIQIDSLKRQVYVKLTDKDYMLPIINNKRGRRGVQTSYRANIPRGDSDSGNGL